METTKKGLIVINWIFKAEEKLIQETTYTDGSGIEYLYSNYKFEDISKFKEKVNDFLKKYELVVLLLHEGNSIDEIKLNIKSDNLITYSFSGGEDKNVYNDKDAFIHTGQNTFSAMKKYCTPKLYDLWLYFTRIKELEKARKKLIDSLMPMAIDIQGISEVSEERKKQYIKEVITDSKQKSGEYKNIFNDYILKLEEFIQHKLDEDKNRIAEFLDKIGKNPVESDFIDKYANKGDLFFPQLLNNILSIHDTFQKKNQ